MMKWIYKGPWLCLQRFIYEIKLVSKYLNLGEKFEED
jgi:hypothetical protein